MMLHAWNNYKYFAWSENELKPISKKGYSPEKYGDAHHLGATIIGSMTTLYMMNLTDELKMTREWAERILNVNVVRENYEPILKYTLKKSDNKLFYFKYSQRMPKYLLLN